MSAGILPPRPYQTETIEALEADWRAGVRRAAVVLPTGTGKTVVFAHLAQRWRAANRSRVLVLAHRDELIEQAADKISMIAPHLSVGIVKAERHEVNRDVIVASVQSLRSQARRERVYDVGLVIVDECHHATAKTYRDILEHFGCFHDQPNAMCAPGDDAVAAGFTATLARGDDASLGEIWQKVTYRQDILWSIRHGYLLDVVGKRVEVDDLELDAVKRRNGDYSEGDLGKALMESLAPELTAKSYLENAQVEGKLRSGVLFAPTVESAHAFADAFNDSGIKTETVHGAMPTAERREIFARAHAGTIDVVSNCMIATEGTDVPRWSVAVIARPTQSAPLYVQMVGRVLRPFAGQGKGQPIDKALVLDVVGVTRRHQLRSLVDLTGRAFREPVEADQSLLEHEEYEDALELQERNAGQGAGLEWEYLTGPTKTVEVDLFESSRSQWLTTDRGTWFLPAGKDHYVFLVPHAPANQYGIATGPVVPGRYDVCWAIVKGRGGGLTQHVGVELEYAMAWGEDTAAEYPDFQLYADKERSWRQVSKPSDKQKDMARGLGLIFAEDVSKGDLSNMISQRMASNRIDKIVQRMGRA